MKTTSRILMTLAAVLAFTGAAQAVSLTVSNTQFSGLVGQNGGFTWSVGNPLSSLSFDLTTPGQSRTFTYGTFTTNDFPLDFNDVFNDGDQFTASFSIIPPGTSASGTGYPDASADWFLVWYNQSASVDFNNTPLTRLFGNGGEYNVVFNDLNGITSNGTYNLTATITLNSDSAPVPEPGTMVLLGAGMLGLAVFGKRRLNKAQNLLNACYLVLKGDAKNASPFSMVIMFIMLMCCIEGFQLWFAKSNCACSYVYEITRREI